MASVSASPLPSSLLDLRPPPPSLCLDLPSWRLPADVEDAASCDSLWSPAVSPTEDPLGATPLTSVGCKPSLKAQPSSVATSSYEQIQRSVVLERKSVRLAQKMQVVPYIPVDVHL